MILVAANPKALCGAFCRYQTLFLSLLLLLTVAQGSALAQTASGILDSKSSMLLVVVPPTIELNGAQVDRWIAGLKAERDRRRHSADELPILRLSPADPSHRAVLRGLGLDDRSEIRTYTCARDAKGWPVKILWAHEPGVPPDRIVARTLEGSEVVSVVPEASVGLLLISRPEDQPKMELFLKELGRFWMSRYGRVRPSPYPVASYDLSNPEVGAALAASFPQLVQSPPMVALCYFRNSQPVEILETYRDLDLPASLVRTVSSARSGSFRAPVVSKMEGAPPATTVGVSVEQEQLLQVMRLQETARQLWNGSAGDEGRQNQAAKRILLRVIEESRRYIDGESAALPLLQESLRDYAVEPLVSEDPKLAEAQARFLQLSRALAPKL